MGDAYRENYKRLVDRDTRNTGDDPDMVRFKDQHLLTTSATGILDSPISGTPASGDVLVFNGDAWVPGSGGGATGPVGPSGATGATGATGPAGSSGAASGAMVLASVQAVGAGGGGAITVVWDRTVFDDGGFYDGGATDRLTIPSGTGRVLVDVGVNLVFEASPSGYRSAQINHYNSADVILNSQRDFSHASDTLSANCSSQTSLTVAASGGDYFTVGASQLDAAAANLNIGNAGGSNVANSARFWCAIR